MADTDQLSSGPCFLPFLAGGGEMGERTRAFDWSATPLGPPTSWPQGLQAAVSICLNSRFPIVLWWGPELRLIYNDAWRPVLGRSKHPQALGSPGRQVWPEIWHIIGPMLEGVLAQGKATWSDDQLLPLDRNGYLEEAYFTYSYSPILGDGGKVGGVFAAVNETTQRVVGERRLKTLRGLAAQAALAKSADEACRAVVATLAANPSDVPFALLYLLSDDQKQARLAGATGLPPEHPAHPSVIPLADESRPIWPLASVIGTGQMLVDLEPRHGEMPTRPWPVPPQQAVLLPLMSSGHDRTVGVLVLGVNPGRELDDEHRGFHDLVAGHVATAIANAGAYEGERRRAEALAELDRAKTAFFSNVSHEFRTPLTLMLGPVEDALAETDGTLPPAQRERLEVVHRNGLRLKKLVNTLLDFSRIEAGRVHASYEPTDLASFTADLASVFRSACERAGLELAVDCPPLAEPVYVDREMWEKIVLNLLSNAFKYTLQGRIAVSLRQDGRAVELAVRDTGTGIPPDQMPHLFERFHRVEGARGRTQEGSGIGLALVRELARLHGGDVRAESEFGKGTVFAVTVPLGTAHLPQDRIKASRTLGSTALGATAYVQEALRWLPDSEEERPARPDVEDVADASRPLATGERPRILLADDNADMRDYIRRLLAGPYDVTAVADGLAAREAVKRHPPDLLLSDVMMPGLDGFGLLRELRADPRTQGLPVILLSARAGEEARVEGLQAGADDYLTKPFSAKELLARIASALEIARLRREALDTERRLLAEVEQQRNWLRVTLDSIGDAVVATDTQGRVAFLNPVAERLTGWPQGEAQGRPLETVFNILHEQTRQPVENPVERVLREGVVVGLGNHTVLVARDGTEWPIDDAAAPIRDSSGGLIGVVLIFRDVTEQRRAERELRASEARKSAVLQTSLDAIITMDHQGRVVEFNPAAERTFGYRREEIVGKELADLIIPPPLRERHHRGLAHYLATGEGPVLGRRLELPALRADGSEFPAELAITCIPTEGPPLFTAYLRDITERARVEQRRSARLAVTHALSEAADVGEAASGVLRAVCENLGWELGFLWTVNEAGDALVCRKSWHRPDAPAAGFESASRRRTFGKGEGLPGRVWAGGQSAWVLDIAQDANFPRLAPAVDYGLHSAVACPVVVGDLTLGVVEFFTRRIREADADLLELLGTVAGSLGQFMERKAAEDELRQSEQELADFFENATVGLHWVGPDGTILRANQAELDLLGYRREEYVGRPITDFHADQDVIADILRRLQAGEKLVEYPARMVCKDGSLRDVLIDSSVLWRDGQFVHTRCFTRDVTERKRAEAALRQSEERLTAELEATTRLHALSTRLLASADLGTALDDVLQEAIRVSRADFGNVQLYNPQSEALEIVAQRGFDRDFLDYFRTVRVDEGSCCAQAMQSGECAVIEDVDLDPSYERHRAVAAAAGYRAVQSTPLKSRGGKVIGMLSTHFRQPHRPSERDRRLLELHARHAADLIERHEFEKALRRSEAQFRQLADAMPQIVWTARPEGEIDYLNRRWTEFTGQPQTAGNEGWGPLLHPDDASPAAERWAACVRSGGPFEMQLRLLDRREQTYRWHLIRTVAVKDREGQVVRWFGTATDIHEQKRAEESARYLAEASAALAAVVDYESTLQKVVNLAVPYFADWSAVDVAHDGDLRRLAVAHQDAGKIDLVQQIMQEYPPDPQAPTGAYAVLRTGRPEFIAEITDDMLVRGARDERHLGLIRSLGLKSYLCVPLVVSGDTLGVLTFATAESGRRYTEADLALATDLAHRAAVAVENTRLYQALRDADRRKDEFLATLAHELRNPLAPIRNSLQILKMPRVDAEMAERSREMMERQVHHLVRLVDDLLDVSRVMRGKIELRKERVELASVVARAVETVQPLMDAQRHDLSVRLPPDTIPLDADPVRLAQVVGNLLTNAAKYTEPGGRISVTAGREGGMAVLRVRDTGIGIAPDMLPKIFELFVQVDHAATRSQGGLGIGLTLVKNLVEMHNGTVEARSEGLGKGSEFVVRLPLAALGLDEKKGQGAGPKSHEPSPSGHRLLVVDDNQDAANSLAMLLRLQGHEVRVAYSGVAALEMTKDYRPDVVFLDIGMPGMDGYEVARRLRQQPGLGDVVLAALTGWGQQKDRRRSAEAGFNHHLVKPPEPKVLDELLTGLR